MWVAREDKTIDTKPGVFANALCYRLRISNKRGSRASPHQADPRPQVGTDLELFPFSSMQLRHSPLADGVETSKCFPVGGNGIICHVTDTVLRSRPGLFFRFANNEMQADPETNSAAMERGAPFHFGNLFSNLLGRLAPGQIYIDMFTGHFMRSGRRAAKIKVGVRPLDSSDQQLRITNSQILALEINGRPRADLT